MTRILISSLAAVLLIGCGDSAQQEPSATPSAPAESAQPAPAPLPEAQPELQTLPASAGNPAAEVPATTGPEAVAAAPAAQASAAKPDGKTLYSRCAGCHGTNGEKSALNASQVIAGWDASRTADALKGYREGSYGGKMKATMAGQASRLNDAEIDALAAYITTLAP